MKARNAKGAILKAQGKRLPFESIKFGEWFAVGRGRHQRFYTKVSPRSAAPLPAGGKLDVEFGPERLVYRTRGGQ